MTPSDHGSLLHPSALEAIERRCETDLNDPTQWRRFCGALPEVSKPAASLDGLEACVDGLSPIPTPPVAIAALGRGPR